MAAQHRPPPTRLPTPAQPFPPLPGLRLASALLLACAALLAACRPQGDEDPEPQPVAGASLETIRTDDGVNLDARLFEANPERLVILLHMFPADQTAWYPFARQLQQRGVSALTLDFRGYGASGGEQDPGEIDHDVRAAIAFARDRGFDGIVLVGASMGGTAAIVVAVEGSVDGVALLSAPSRMRGLDAKSTIGGVTCPLTLIAAEGDLAAMNALDSFAKRAGLDEGSRLVVPGVAHGTDLLDSPHGDAVRERLFDFLAEVWEG